MIPASSFGNILILYCFDRAVLDAGHTVSASLFFPYRFSALHFDDVERTQPRASSTGDAVLFHPESFCTLIEITQYRGDRNCDQILKKENVPIFDTSSAPDLICHVLYFI